MALIAAVGNEIFGTIGLSGDVFLLGSLQVFQSIRVRRPFRSIAVVVACAASVATATTVKLISPSAISSTALAVNFNGAPTGTNEVARTYRENGLMLTAPSIFTETNTFMSPSQFLFIASTGGPILWSFDAPVTQIDFQTSSSMRGVTLYADAAGTQSLGFFLLPQAANNNPLTHYTFESDTPFKSFYPSTNVGSGAIGDSYYVEDLRYTAVPEPSVLATIGAIGLIGIGSHRRRRTA